MLQMVCRGERDTWYGVRDVSSSLVVGIEVLGRVLKDIEGIVVLWFCGFVVFWSSSIICSLVALSLVYWRIGSSSQ